MAKNPLKGEQLATEKAAKRVAKLLGCEGAHKDGDGWFPCESTEAMRILITKGKAAYTDWKVRHTTRKARTKGSVKTIIMDEGAKEEAERRRRRRYRISFPKRRCPKGWPCPKKRDWEKLRSRGVTSIDSHEGVGITGSV